MAHPYVPAPTKPETFTPMTPLQFVGVLLWFGGIYAVSLALFPVGG